MFMRPEHRQHARPQVVVIVGCREGLRDLGWFKKIDVLTSGLQAANRRADFTAKASMLEDLLHQLRLYGVELGERRLHCRLVVDAGVAE
jgi:hypothetical protein